MRYEQEVRDALINNTIHLIAEGGFEKATTKAITYSGQAPPNIKMNEIYIYRLFGSKETLYATAFSCLDKEIVLAFRRCIALYQNSGFDRKKMLYEAFRDAWHFVLSNEDRCRCYIRYYYSIYFKGESLKNHNRIFDEIIDGFSPMFKEEADVQAIMHSVFTTLLDFAVRVYNGDLKNTEENKSHIFNVIYCMMSTYFKNQDPEHMPAATII